jgi:putative RecB family exonuclease
MLRNVKNKLEALTGKTHISHSALDTFQQCGEKFRLSRIYQVPEEQAWWFIGGSAIHTATEWWDKGDDRRLHEIWNAAWTEETKDVDTSRPIRAGGKATKQWPDKENAAWWGFHGPAMLEGYVNWRRQSGWELYTVDGTPFVEWEFLIDFPNPKGDTPIQVKGYIDRVFITPDGEPVVVDIKAGSRVPASSGQLGLYAAALRRKGGVDPALGGYYMTRKNEMAALRPMTMYTDELLSYWLGSFTESVVDERFLPHVTSMCATCTVAPYCYAVGGTPPENHPFRKGGK